MLRFPAQNCCISFTKGGFRCRAEIAVCFTVTHIWWFMWRQTQ